jgi:hypothetical protein
MARDFKKNLIPFAQKRIAGQKSGHVGEDEFFPNDFGESILSGQRASNIEYSQLLLKQIKAA